MKKNLGPNPLFDAQPGRRAVRSFVLREGRLTPAQSQALTELWPQFGIDNGEDPIDLAACFGRQAPLMVEVGFGDGEALAVAAQQSPDQNFLGIEVHRPGVGRMLQRIEELGLTNVRLVCADAVQVLNQRIPDGSMAMFRLYFPDPWPKKRHHKRRIVQSDFIDLVTQKTEIGGRLHLATDWEPYALHMMEVLEACRHLKNQEGPANYSARPEWRCETKFERRGIKLGHQSWDLLFHRIDPEAVPPDGC